MSQKRVIYYVDPRGRSPVLEELQALAPHEQQKVLAYLSLLEERGEALRRPLADYMGGKLYELRPKAHRVLYFFMLREYAVVVHLFRKKTDQLPERERQVALRRMRDFVQRFGQGRVQ